MRLINVKTYALQEFLGDNVPKYAILSHRWGSEEISFLDMSRISDVEHKQGFQQLKMLCQIAKMAGFDFAWMDTCCINKDSSAELSEAINSMYRWYAESEVCYAFLGHVKAGQNDAQALREFEDGVWLKRGWSLQELTAPKSVIFQNDKWQVIGDKSGLAPSLNSWTRISPYLLAGQARVEQFFVAQRMSWAAERKTTRSEVVAYSRFGLFDIDMPLLGWRSGCGHA